MDRNEAQNILNRGFIHTIKDPLWQNILFTGELKALLENPDVEKLSRIKQNGPSYHIYPGAVHTRLNHSIGVYYLGREILLSISRKREDLPFTKRGIMSFLVACLLHDIGHFPYAHSLKELPLREHEEIASDMIMNHPQLREDIEKTGADCYCVSSIIDKGMLTGDEETLLYRNILSGTLDPDKLDYLSRDGFFSGVPYGRQDTAFIISSLSLENNRLTLEREAISSVEQILFSKYMMYRTLYWHKGVRSATAMIKKAITRALREKTIMPEELYGLSDSEFVLLSLSRREKTEALNLVERVDHNKLLERKIDKEYDKGGKIELESSDFDRKEEMERNLYNRLKDKYPTLLDYEIIIDIPEPINFESHIALHDSDGAIREISEEDMIFDSHLSDIFQKSLRRVAFYAPNYVKKEDCLLALSGYLYE